MRYFPNRSGNFAKEPQLIKRQSNLNYLIGIGAIVLALSTGATTALANDSERITPFENEVQQLKQRMSSLEKLSSVPAFSPKPLASSDGWKSLANWRSLKKGLTPNDVRYVLGEPETVRASGPITRWFYQNRGDITFYDERLDGWTEPK